MKISTLAGSFLASLALIATPLSAQQVSADVVVRSGPVAGRISVGDQYSSYHRSTVYRRAPARVVVVERAAPRVIVIERARQHPRKHWKRLGYRPVVVYYLDGRYYEWSERRHPRAREVVVYERDGRFYRAH